MYKLACGEIRRRTQVVEHNPGAERGLSSRALADAARFLRDRRGSSTAEYAVIAAIVATAILFTLAHTRHA